VNVLDLFSGIGGFSLGLERAGMRTVAFCERDTYCRAVLAKHWPSVPCHNDVRSIPRIGDVDVVAGGFPCQPWSHAGRQLGSEDDRHLWPAMFEVIKRERPAWVIGENVTGIIKLGIDAVLADLEAEGYAWRAFIIPAVAVDAPHRRDRVWIVANDDDRGRLQRAGDGEPAQGVVEQQGHDVTGLRTIVPDAGRIAAQVPPAWQQSTEPEIERPCQWEAEPGVGRVVDGIPRRVDRLKALGNAVVPQIVEQIGRAIMRASPGLGTVTPAGAVTGDSDV